MVLSLKTTFGWFFYWMILNRNVLTFLLTRKGLFLCLKENPHTAGLEFVMNITIVNLDEKKLRQTALFITNEIRKNKSNQLAFAN